MKGAKRGPELTKGAKSARRLVKGAKKWGKVYIVAGGSSNAPDHTKFHTIKHDFVIPYYFILSCSIDSR